MMLIKKMQKWEFWRVTFTFKSFKMLLNNESSKKSLASKIHKHMTGMIVIV